MVDEIGSLRQVVPHATLPADAQQFADQVAADLFTEAERSSAKRQYAQAKEMADLAIRLAPNNTKLKNLRKKIAERERKPETVNISGVWVHPKGAEMQFEDKGGKYIEFKMLKFPPNTKMASCEGKWLRNNAVVVGQLNVRFSNDVRGIVTKGAVKGKIESPDVLLIEWDETRWINFKKMEWQGVGASRWTKKAAERAKPPANQAKKVADPSARGSLRTVTRLREIRAHRGYL